MIEIIPNWHPIFVHFTVGLLSSSVLLYVVARLVPHSRFATFAETVARGNLWLGTLITVLTVIAGWLAFNSVQHDEPAHEVMLEHRNLALLTLAVFAVLAVWAWRAAGTLEAPRRTPGGLFVVATLVALGLLTATAWHGAELVFRHGLGVMSLPAPEAGGHDHGHGGHAAHGTVDHADESAAAHDQDHDHDHDQDGHDAPAAVDHADESGTDHDHDHDHEHSH